ncbi:MAG: cell division protein SepF [Candidatus Bilamarchaeaceae archaeon]
MHKEGGHMGLFDKIFGKEKSETPNLEELMNEEGDVVNPPADFYIKRIDLRNEGDADLVIKELSEKNIIILNVMPISKQPNRLKGIIAKLKNNATKINGDISLISKESGLLILTPTNVKIVKSKKKPSTGATLIS